MSTFRDEIDTLLNEGIRIAVEFLEKDREFFPFALRLTQDGDIDLIQADLGEEVADVAELVEAAELSLREMADRGEILAGVVVSDVFVSQADSDEAGDAVQLAIEHAQGIAVECFLPYAWKDEALELGELFSQQAEHKIFGSDDGEEPTFL